MLFLINPVASAAAAFQDVLSALPFPVRALMSLSVGLFFVLSLLNYLRTV